MKTVVIAMERGSFRRAVKREMKKGCRVVTAEDGPALAQAVEREAPDVVVLQPELPGLDPVDFLRHRQKDFRVLAVAGFVSPYLTEALRGLGVSYLMVRPCLPETVAQRARELLEPAVGQQARLGQLLSRFSVPVHILGGRCLLLAIPRSSQISQRLLTGSLYPQVGAELGLDWRLVERNIRYAIAKGWERGDRSLWLRNFPGGRPTNGEFIAAMARLDGLRCPEPGTGGAEGDRCG